MSFRSAAPMALAVSVVLVLAGCAADPATPADPADSADPALTVLAAHGLSGMDAREVIDHLDAMPVEDRPTDLMASIRPDQLQLSDQQVELVELPMPTDQVYVAVAPYLNSTHDCFFHSLTTCHGELGDTAMRVTLVAQDGEVLIDELRTSFDNGFVGLWLPRDVTGELTIAVDGMTATTAVSTVDADDPTCITEMHLA